MANDPIALFRQLLGPGLGVILPLDSLPPKHQEIERKYRLGKVGDDIPRVHVGAMASICTCIRDDTNARILFSTEFTGVDEYWIVHINSMKLAFRLRLGANKPLELAVKFELIEGDIERRGEISLKLSNNEPETVRFVLSLLAKTDPNAKVFPLSQRGTIWHLDVRGELLEVVCYTVERIVNRTPDTQVFVELEALKWSEPAKALALIDAYEKKLGLETKRCEQSFSEIFAPP